MRETISVQKDKQVRFPWVLVLFITLTLVCLVLLNRGVSSASRIGCYLLIGWAILLPTDDLLCLIAIVLPTGNIYKLSGGYTAIPFLLLVYIVKSLVKSGTKMSADIARPLFWTFVLFVLSAITSMANNISIIEILPFFMHLVFIVIALRMNHVNEENKYNSIAFYFVTGTLLVCLGTVLFPNVSKSISNIAIYSKANPGFASTWDFGRSLSISIAFIIVSFLKTKKKIILDFALIFIMLYFLIQCGRFSMLLGLGALLVCIPFAYGTDKSLRQRILYTVVMFVVIAIASYIMIRYVYSSMVELRGYAASENGRFNVWSTYLNYLGNNPLVVAFGTGGGTIGSVAPTLGVSTAHNVLLEKVIEVGIVGLIIFLLYFTTLYRDKALNPSRNINVLPLVTFLGTAMTQGTTGNVAFALLLAMCVADKNVDNSGYMEAQNEYPVRN